VSIGVFGDRFADIATTYGVSVEKLSFEQGTAADPAKVAEALKKDPSFKAVLVTHNETSTGVTNDLEAIAKAIRGLRPNILIGGVSGMDETTWPGGELHIGEAVIRLDSLRARCPMTTVDPDTLERDPSVLRDIGRRFHGRLALNADVLRPGLIRLGDQVTLVRAQAEGLSG